MTLIAAFAIVLGVPAALASVLGGLALLLYVPAYTLADIGADRAWTRVVGRTFPQCSLGDVGMI
jgi:hypothetical protein